MPYFGETKVSFLNFIKIIDALEVDDVSAKRFIQNLRANGGI
jgi:hypothetical protein